MTTLCMPRTVKSAPAHPAPVLGPEPRELIGEAHPGSWMQKIDQYKLTEDTDT
jgi:hypothetical protein